MTTRKKHSRPLKNNRLTLNEKRLVRRYLVWCYKTTKEELDRIDRKFTQLRVDAIILDYHLGKVNGLPVDLRQDYLQHIEEFKAYIQKKEEDAASSKFLKSDDKPATPQYVFLANRFAAIKQAISCFLGGSELKTIEALYEEEMTDRILKSREHT
ncbi:MAG TPA: hypothetical protein PL155_06660 [Candidatus Omnitrophota bacterium]|nr:hypothetical protein [Candidatus Omnitrophota bacterium]HPD83840.1 hypothetical protein [Candidatus Omnitrophota bacterium]HRZ02697.1 hypothetical protein [Candidatus Omnitrophota bacterium]